MQITIKSKRDIHEMLRAVRREVANIRTIYFDEREVTAESWAACPYAVVSYHKSKIPMLEATGVMKPESEFEYGWKYSNAYHAKVNAKLTNADRRLMEILDFLQECRITRKARFSEYELSRFEVIEGGGQQIPIVEHLMRGAILKGASLKGGEA